MFNHFFLLNKLIFSLVYAINAESNKVSWISCKASTSFLSAAKSIASLILPILCNNKYCSSFCFYGILAITFIAHDTYRFFNKKSAIISTGILNFFWCLSIKVIKSSNLFWSINTFIFDIITLLSSKWYSAFISSTASASPLCMKKFSWFDKLTGFAFEFLYLTWSLCLRNWEKWANVFSNAVFLQSFYFDFQSLRRVLVISKSL